MTLHLYVLRQLAWAAAFSLMGIGVLVLPSIAIKGIHKLGGVSLMAVIDYLPLVIVELVPYLLPMAFLLGVVATFGRLAADREWTAIRSAGIHPARLLVPGLVLAVPLTAATAWLLGSVTPQWKYIQRNFVRKAEENALQAFGQGRTEFEFGPFYLKAAKAQGGVFHEVILSAPDEEGVDRTLIADRAELSLEGRTLVVRFEGAQALTRDANPYNQAPELRLSLDDISPYVPISDTIPKFRRSDDLLRAVRSGNLELEERHQFLYEIHRRRALSATYVVFLLLGVPTGLALRSGTQLSAFTIAVGFAFLYYVLALRLGKELALVGAVPPLAAAWATNVLFLAAALPLNMKVLWR